MRILVVIPTSSSKLNKATERSASKYISPGTKVEVINLENAPESIESHHDSALAAPALIEAIVEAERKGYDAAVIACFDDPGLHAARERTSIPVLGLGETSMTVAALLGNKFAVISTGKNSKAIYERKAMELGLNRRLAYSTGIDMAVLKLREEEARAKQMLIQEARKAIDNFGADVIVLGCGGMTGFSRELFKALKVPVIDPLLVTLKLAETLAGLGLRHSKAWFYNIPPHKR